MLWAEQLTIEASKKVKNDESQVYQAVGAIIQITVQCLERNPDSRPKSDVLESKIAEYIRKFAHTDPHCVAQNPPVPDNTSSILSRQRSLEEPPLLMSPIRMRSDRSLSRTRHATIEEEPVTRPSTVHNGSVRSDFARPATSRTIVPTHSPPSVSLSSLPSVSIDMDNQSDTVVGYDQSRESSIRHRHGRRGVRSPEEAPEIEAWTVPERSTPKEGRRHRKNRDRVQYEHANDSAVDPHLTLSSNGSDRGGVFTYINYSTSPSEDGEGSTTYSYPLPPSAPPPNRSLPTPPRQERAHHIADLQRQPPPDKRQRYVKSPPADPSREEIAMLKQLSRTAVGGHPPRMSSLVPGQSEDEDEIIARENARGGRRALTPGALRAMSAMGGESGGGGGRERVYRVRG
jgi:hypothetical protein